MQNVLQKLREEQKIFQSVQNAYVSRGGGTGQIIVGDNSVEFIVAAFDNGCTNTNTHRVAGAGKKSCN